jgi:hypothetical protein
MKRAEFEQHVGTENICLNITAALARAQELYGKMSPEDQSMNLRRRKSDAVEKASAATV